MWERRADLHSKEITIYNPSFVCCRQEHSSSLYVCVCDGCECACVCVRFQYPSHQPIECYSVFQCSDLSCFSASGRWFRLLWSRMAGSVAWCSVAVANLLPPLSGMLHHSLPLEKQERCGAAPRAKTHRFMTSCPIIVHNVFYSVEGSKHEHFLFSVQLMGTVTSDMHTPSCPPSCCCHGNHWVNMAVSFFSFFFFLNWLCDTLHFLHHIKKVDTRFFLWYLFI